MRTWALFVVAACSSNHSVTSDPLVCDHTQGAQTTCCETQADCKQGVCAPPGVSQGCGACRTDPGNCTADADCTGTDVCDPIECSCNGQLACVPGCVDDTTCGEGTTCDLTTNRCAPKACATDADCPADFSCHATCARSTCTTDADCDNFCVGGTCFAKAGECQLPVP
jgi:hypothetical protein